MEVAIAFVVGGVCGWLVARLGQRNDAAKRTFRPNRRQRKILAALPPDPVRPTIEDLVAEEAAELGVDVIPGADEVALGVRLRVWKRDRPDLGDCPDHRLHFVVTALDSITATAADVTLQCRPDDDSA